jgi:hypothetical protein
MGLQRDRDRGLALGVGGAILAVPGTLFTVGAGGAFPEPPHGGRMRVRARSSRRRERLPVVAPGVRRSSAPTTPVPPTPDGAPPRPSVLVPGLHPGDAPPSLDPLAGAGR